MQGMTLQFGARAIGLLLLLTGCTATAIEPRQIQIQQAWQLQPGDTVGGRRISAGLGDVSIELKGGWVYAPFDGQVQPYEGECVMFSSPQIPAYLVRLCGLSRPQLGEVKQGDAIGWLCPKFGFCHAAPPARWQVGNGGAV